MAGDGFNTTPNAVNPADAPKASVEVPVAPAATGRDDRPATDDASTRLVNPAGTVHPNVSIDYLLIDTAERRPLHSPATGIDNRLEAIAQLSDEDTAALNNIIDALTTRTRLRLITN